MKDLLSQMQNDGYSPPDLILDGKIHRWGPSVKKSNWYIGFQNFSDETGQQFVVAQYGSWKMDEALTFHSSIQLSKQDRKKIKERIAEAQRKTQHEKEKLQIEVAEESQSFFETLGEIEITSYMQRKRVSNHYGARTQFGNLYVPVRDIDGKLWSVQTITEAGAKYFAEGGRITGGFHSIGNILEVETIYICEGFATGVSIYESIHRPIVIAFNAYNLAPVSEAIKKRFPDKQIIICGDDDRWALNAKGEAINPGRDRGSDAAKKVLGVAIFPVFKSLDGQPTDFNDLFLREGASEVKKQIEPVKGQKHFVRPLGFIEKEYFFTSTANEQIVQVHAFSETDFFNLMPQAYWESVYPGTRTNIDWQRAKSELMSACRRKGIFNATHVRGSGVWLDSGKVVVNQGDHLLVDGSVVSLSDFKSDFFYTLGRSLPKLNLDPLSVQECQLLIEICDTFRWRKKDFGKFLAGFLVISKICGSLNIRPHIWLTGGSQTGKTTLLQRLIFPALKNYSVYFLGGTTEAGLRQALHNDSIPVIFDEFETNSPRSSENIQACIEFMRSAWSDTGGGVAKGSSGGSAKFYYPRFSAIVSSIRPGLVNDADRSRFTLMELAPHGNDEAHWKYLSSLLDMFDRTYIDRLFVRSLKNVTHLEKSYRAIRAALSRKVGSRFGEQHGMLLAGYWMLLSDEPCGAVGARALVEGLELEHETSDASLTDERECFDHLMRCRLRFQIGRDHFEKSIEQIVVEGNTETSAYFAALEIYGVKLASDGSGLYVSFSNPELKAKVFKDTRWLNCWSVSLSRLPNAKRTATRMFGKPKTCVFIPWPDEKQTLP